MFNRMFNKWGQNAVIPIYTHIPQYPEITGISLSLHIIEWFRCLPLEGMVMQKHPTHKSAKGFTLIELLIVIATISGFKGQTDT